MEFIDPQGKVIRTFTGTPADAERKPPADDDDDGPRRPPDPHPPVAAGLQRARRGTCAIRARPIFPGLIMWAASSRGPLAPPGTYQVKVTADGATATAAVRDPARADGAQGRDRSGSAASSSTSPSRCATRRARPTRRCCWSRGIKAQIQDRKSKLDAKSAPVAKALDDFAAALSAIEGEIYQVKLQSSQDPLNFPIKLNNKIAALQGVIESADVEPTEQAYSVFRTLSNRLDEQLDKLDATSKTQMPPVNQLLQRQKLEPIKAERLKVDEKAPPQ